MKRALGWILAIVLGLVGLLGLGALFFGWRWMRFSPWGMMGGRDVTPFGFYGHMSPFGGFMFLGWLIPVGLFILLVVGIAWLVNSLGKPKPIAPISPTTPLAAEAVVEHNCNMCGKALQSDWTVCAYCGTPVTPPGERKCAACGKPAAADWKTCPYCGSSLT